MRLYQVLPIDAAARASLPMWPTMICTTFTGCVGQAEGVARMWRGNYSR